MGGRLTVDWQESSEELKPEDVVDLTGASYRSVQQWLRWYRQGGLSEVLRRVVGHHAKGKNLNRVQQRAFVSKVQQGEFRTVWM